MKKLVSILLIALMVFASGCGGGTAGESLDELLSLGQKYLLEENYEEAVVAFEKAIRIDEKCVEAYLGLADAYVGKGDPDKALEILGKGYEITEDDRLNDKYLELSGSADGESVFPDGLQFPIRAVEGLPLHNLRSYADGGYVQIKGEHDNIGKVNTLISTWWTKEDGRPSNLEETLSLTLEAWKGEISGFEEEQFFGAGFPVDEYEKGHVVYVWLAVIDEEFNPVNHAIVEIDLSVN